MATEPYCFSFLDSENAVEVEMYERAMYRAFPVARNVVEVGFIYDHKLRKIRSEILYRNQKIFICKPGERILSSVAINNDMENKLQLEMEGFCIEKKAGICEALSLFNFGDTTQFKIFMEDVMRYFKREKIVKIYGTCNDKNLKPYMTLGFQHEASNGKSHLISIAV